MNSMRATATGVDVGGSPATLTGLSAEETALAVASDHHLRVPNYCEENVWRLVYRKKHEQLQNQYWVVFISNSVKNVPMFQQRSNPDPNKSVCWDYHVILLGREQQEPMQVANEQQETGGLLVYDMDSYLPYPCPLSQYLQYSFPYEWPLPFSPLFRVVEADLYLQYFCSDRMHMYNKANGTWNAPPPQYQPIQGQSQTISNLHHYLNFVDRPVFSEVMEEDARAYGTILSMSQLKNAVFAVS